MRNKLAWIVCNFAINRIADPWYRERLDLIYNLGADEYKKILSAERAHGESQASGKD